MSTISYKQTGYAVLELLKRRTDESHRLKQVEIVALLEEETGVIHARKSIRKDLKELQAAGYPIRFNHGWYYEHEFCPAELNLMIDTLRCAAGITTSQRDELIRKLSRLGGEWYGITERGEQLRPTNPQFLFTLDILHEAIAKGKQVCFFYGNYGTDKQLHYRCRDDGNPRDYLINPYHVLTTNGRYYLLANVDKYTSLAHFRIERIMDIQLLDTPVKPVNQVDGVEADFDIRQYATDHPYMYNGEPKKCRFRVMLSGINDVLDWFGMDTVFKNEKNGTVEVLVKTDEVSLDFWKRRYAEYLLPDDKARQKTNETIRGQHDGEAEIRAGYASDHP